MFAPLNGVKEFEAELKSYDKESATLVMDDDTEVTVKRSEISLIRPAIEF